jgi:hypothetical protein
MGIVIVNNKAFVTCLHEVTEALKEVELDKTSNEKDGSTRTIRIKLFTSLFDFNQMQILKHVSSPIASSLRDFVWDESYSNFRIVSVRYMQWGAVALFPEITPEQSVKQKSFIGCSSNTSQARVRAQEIHDN